MNIPMRQDVRSLMRQQGENMGRALIAMGKITPDGVERVLKLQKEKGIRFGEAARMLNLVSEADIRQVLSRQFDYPYLRHGAHGLSAGVVTALQPFSQEAENYRALRSQLTIRWFSKERKSLAVVGVDEQADSSLVAANLAVVFSQLGARTLLVDANLRTPRLRKIFGFSDKAGLSDVLIGRAEVGVICLVPSFPDLSVLCAGTIPPNPQELLSRKSFGELSAKLASEFDIVLYEASSLQAADDAIHVAAQCGGALLVAKRNHTRLANMRASMELLNRADVETVGSILLDD